MLCPLAACLMLPRAVRCCQSEELSLRVLNNIGIGARQTQDEIPDPLAELLGLIVDYELPLDLFAAAGHIPESARVGLNTKTCLMGVPCSPTTVTGPNGPIDGVGRNILVRGNLTMTLGDTAEPAFKDKSIHASHLNDNFWIPKQYVKIQCDLVLSPQQKAIIANDNCDIAFPPPNTGK